MTWQDLPRGLKIYIIFLVIVSSPIVIRSIWDVTINWKIYGIDWIILTILTIITVPAFFRLPSVSTIALIGDAYVMAIAMLYGSSPCIIATALHSFLASTIVPSHPTKHLYRMAFNISSSVCCAWAYNSVYRLMNPSYSKYASDVALPLVGLTITFFVLNSLSTAAAICLETRQKLFSFWSKNYLPLGVEFSVSSVCAALIVTLYQFGRWIPLIAAPFISIIWGWNKLNKARADEAERHLKEQEELYLRTVESLALAVDAKDQTTYGHIRRVKVYAMGLAKLAGIKDPNELKAIETGALLHDIGKLAIDDYILNKPGKLTKQEFEKIKMHSAAGDEILQQIRFPFPVAKYVRFHHERWDGKGYPDGLKGEEIPVGARILAIADAFDAIRFSRPYKLSMVIDEALDILRSQSGTVFDPKLVQLFIENIRELDIEATRESANAPELSFRKHFEGVDQAITISDVTTSPILPQDIPAELVHLAEFCSTMTGHLDLNDILPIVARRMERLLPFTTCAFYITDGQDNVEAFYASGKFSNLIQGHKLALGKGISGWVTAYRRPMINTGPALDFQGIKGDFSSLVDALVVPIVYEDDSLGTISLYAQDMISYSQHELALLQIIAGFLAPIIADAKKDAVKSSENLVDPATRIYRISFLTAIGPQLIANAAKNRSPISLIYIGIKNLYQIMRIYGEPTGSSIVRRVAECIKAELRETDILVRYGSQGFIAFLPGVRADQAFHAVKRLKQQIKIHNISVAGQSIPIDFGIGLSSYPKDGTTIFALIQSAQQSIANMETESKITDSNVVDFLPRP